MSPRRGVWYRRMLPAVIALACVPAPAVVPEGCLATAAEPVCSYTAAGPGLVSGAWTAVWSVTVTRGGQQVYVVADRTVALAELPTVAGDLVSVFLHEPTPADCAEPPQSLVCAGAGAVAAGDALLDVPQ